MARVHDPTPDELEAWETWVQTRPPVLRSLIELRKFDPWTVYRLKTSKHRVLIYSFDIPEDGSPVTLRVNVTGEFNVVAFERTVFGIEPDDLEECELPGPDEIVGSADMDPQEARALADELRLRRN